MTLLFESCAMAEANILPVAGGLLDQTRWWLDAWRFFRGEKADHEARQARE